MHAVARSSHAGELSFLGSPEWGAVAVVPSLPVSSPTRVAGPSAVWDGLLSCYCGSQDRAVPQVNNSTEHLLGPDPAPQAAQLP